MSAMRLSVCIPVHNFGAFLGETLESLEREATDQVEIVVVDGASTDDTPAVVDRFRRRFRSLRYCRLPVKGGIDRDMAKAVELARGEYCWLLSGDDLVVEGAIPRVLRELGFGCDVYLLESMLCRFDMTPIERHGMLSARSPTTFHLDDERDRRNYFRRARNTAAFFSFCSSLVVKRSRWEAAPVDGSFDGTCWAHVARLFSLIPSGLAVRYLPEVFVLKRGENDSFLTAGLTRRFAISIDGYHRLADAFFGHDALEAKAIRASLRNEISLNAWGAAKVDVAENRRDQCGEFRRLLWKQYSDPSLDLWKPLALELTPAWALRLLRTTLVGLRRTRARLRPR